MGPTGVCEEQQRPSYPLCPLCVIFFNTSGKKADGGKLEVKQRSRKYELYMHMKVIVPLKNHLIHPIGIKHDSKHHFTFLGAPLHLPSCSKKTCLPHTVWMQDCLMALSPLYSLDQKNILNVHCVGITPRRSRLPFLGGKQLPPSFPNRIQVLFSVYLDNCVHSWLPST